MIFFLPQSNSFSLNTFADEKPLSANSLVSLYPESNNRASKRERAKLLLKSGVYCILYAKLLCF